MNPLLVLLLLVIIFVIFIFIYRVLYPPITQLKTLTNLNYPVPAISITDNNATSANVSYGVWLYVNSWNNTTSKIIFSRSGDLALYLDKNTPTLYVDVSILQPSGQTNNDYNIPNAVLKNAQTITVTNNFPVQKWVYVIVSLDSRGFTDIYLDGKLVKSMKLYNVRPPIPDASTAITIGNSSGSANNAGYVGTDSYITQFVRYIYTMDPQTAWNLYLKGNGSGGLFSQYSVDVAIFKNGVLQNDITLF